mgnify:CR=1 FL=1
MRKIKNREMASEWTLAQQEESKSNQSLEEQLNLLEYASTKRKTGYPSIRKLGMNESAELLNRAYALIEEAYRIALVEASLIKEK